MDLFEYAVTRANKKGTTPQGKITITQNGTGLDISQYAEADVAVPGVQPEGRIPIAQNGIFDVSQYAEAEVNVGDKPTKGIVVGDFNANGCPTSVTTYGFTAIPSWFFYQLGYNQYSRQIAMGYISSIRLNEGITLATGDSSFRQMERVTELQMPSTLEQVGHQSMFIATPLTLLDMSLLDHVPTLMTAKNRIGLPSGVTIRVKQSLLAEWQSATNWCDLTDVVWQGV